MEVDETELMKVKAGLLVLESLLTGLLLNSLRAEPGALDQYRKDAQRMIEPALSQRDQATRRAMKASFDDIMLMLETALRTVCPHRGQRPPPQ